LATWRSLKKNQERVFAQWRLRFLYGTVIAWYVNDARDAGFETPPASFRCGGGKPWSDGFGRESCCKRDVGQRASEATISPQANSTRNLRTCFRTSRSPPSARDVGIERRCVRDHGSDLITAENAQ